VPFPELELNMGARVENALNMNYTKTAISSDKPVDEGKSKVFFGNGMWKVTRRSQGIDLFLGDELFYVQDAIRNDVVKSNARIEQEEITNASGENTAEYKLYTFITDPLRYRNAVINNLVAGITYLNIRDFELNSRLMLGYENHMGIDKKFYETKTRADFTYESFWEPYPSRSIVKSYFLTKLGYTKKWSFEYEGWKSVINLMNRLKVMPQFKIAYELRKNLKENGEDADPRKMSQYSREDLLSLDDQAIFKNLWQEYSSNYTDYLLSVPLVRCNFQIAEKTVLEAGIQWMRAFDRVTEPNSFTKVSRVVQITNRDSYAGYNIALMFGLNAWDYTYDINRHDPLLDTGKEFNNHFSQVFAKVYAGL
jgi:hypothetical protein